MGPRVPTQQRAFASLSHFPKALWLTGQDILYQQNSTLVLGLHPWTSTEDYTMEKRWKMADCVCPLSPSAAGKRPVGHSSHTPS